MPPKSAQDRTNRKVALTKEEFLLDRQGRTFADVVDEKGCPFDLLLEFLNDENRQRRMEESEIHHDRAPLAGVVRELEAVPEINRFLGEFHPKRTRRFRQAVGVLVRIIMEHLGWKTTGRKGSLGVRSESGEGAPARNTGGLAFWFIRGERYTLEQGMPFSSVRERCKEVESNQVRRSSTECGDKSKRRKSKP